MMQDSYQNRQEFRIFERPCAPCPEASRSGVQSSVAGSVAGNVADLFGKPKAGKALAVPFPRRLTCVCVTLSVCVCVACLNSRNHETCWTIFNLKCEEGDAGRRNVL